MFQTHYKTKFESKMQSFAKRIRACRGYRFFYTNTYSTSFGRKRTGVWHDCVLRSKAPNIKTKHKFIFDKIQLFRYILHSVICNTLIRYEGGFGSYKKKSIFKKFF